MLWVRPAYLVSLKLSYWPRMEWSWTPKRVTTRKMAFSHNPLATNFHVYWSFYQRTATELLQWLRGLPLILFWPNLPWKRRSVAKWVQKLINSCVSSLTWIVALSVLIYFINHVCHRYLWQMCLFLTKKKLASNVARLMRLGLSQFLHWIHYYKKGFKWTITNQIIQYELIYKIQNHPDNVQ